MASEKIKRLSLLMQKQGVDAVVTASPENFAYANDFVIPSQPIMRWRHAFTVITADMRHAVVVIDMEESTVHAHNSDIEVRVWGEFVDDPIKVLSELLIDLGLERKNIALELDYLNVNDYNRLLKHLPNTCLSSADSLLNRARQIKSPDEIALLRRLSIIADKSILDSLERVSPGDSEMDIASALTHGIYSQGATDFKLMIVATGERSMLPNVGPSDRNLKNEDVCRVEIFAVINGYQAGVCRTAVVNRAPPQADRIWKHLIECKYLVLDMIKPGVSSREVYEAFTKHLRTIDLELPPIKFIGHSIGLNLHEEPYLSMCSDVPLESGMVLGIEPLVYNTGFGFGMQNKDMITVTDTGCELLSDHTNTDELIVIS